MLAMMLRVVVGVFYVLENRDRIVRSWVYISNFNSILCNSTWELMVMGAIVVLERGVGLDRTVCQTDC
jgi:hypothetical protein